MNWGNNPGGSTMLWQLHNFPSANFDEDEDLDYGDSRSYRTQSRSALNNQAHKFLSVYNKNRATSDSDYYTGTTKSASKNNFRQQKVFLNNITVFAGDLVRLPCPYAHPEISDYSRPDEYFSTKTVSLILLNY